MRSSSWKSVANQETEKVSAPNPLVGGASLLAAAAETVVAPGTATAAPEPLRCYRSSAFTVLQQILYIYPMTIYVIYIYTYIYI